MLYVYIQAKHSRQSTHTIRNVILIRVILSQADTSTDIFSNYLHSYGICSCWTLYINFTTFLATVEDKSIWILQTFPTQCTIMSDTNGSKFFRIFKSQIKYVKLLSLLRSLIHIIERRCRSKVSLVSIFTVIKRKKSEYVLIESLIGGYPIGVQGRRWPGAYRSR